MLRSLSMRFLSLLLAAALCAGLFVPAVAAEDPADTVRLDFQRTEWTDSYGKLGAAAATEGSEAQYAPDDIVRVSIVLERAATLNAGFSTRAIAGNQKAMAYREALRQEQAAVTAAIEQDILNGETLDVVWNLTLVGNIISANVEYGQLDALAEVPGVASVELEAFYAPAEVESTPNMATSGSMIGTTAAWAEGYTGAGMRIAVVDTGTDMDHQSFDAGAYLCSLAYQAGLADQTVDAYIESLNLLDREEIEAVWDQLHATANQNLYTGLSQEVTSADELYLNAKLPFAYNYADRNLKVTHDEDSQGGHGSHVAGIAAANAYIPTEDGSYVNALESVKVRGVAPDAQIITLKVFGYSGGAADSDYMAAIEDAIVLGCDAINLSLGSVYPGFVRSAAYQEILDNLENCDAVVTISAGNSGHWADSSVDLPGYLRAEDVSADTVSQPAAFSNALTVASADNDGVTDNYLLLGDEVLFYTETSYTNAAMTSIAGDYEYVYIDSIGTPEEFAALGEVLTDKIAVCNRGSTSFYEKANAAVSNGAAAVIIVNNTEGSINMDLTGYAYTQPCVSVTMEVGLLLKSDAVTDEAGNTLYYTGKLTVGGEIEAFPSNAEYYAMSSFSSWGVPGDLSLKPEITAPGGGIYSVNGEVADGTAYAAMSGTSMAAPQVAGMAALVTQYIQENDLVAKTGLSARQLAQSLLMSTAVPLTEEASGYVYPVLRQGAGLANVGSAITAGAYILMDSSACETAADGKVKAELGDDPDRGGRYTWTFTIHNFSDETQQYTLATQLYTQGTFTYENKLWMDTATVPLAADMIYSVDGTDFLPSFPLTADVDLDGDTDMDDAQAALEYAVGIRSGEGLDLNAADQSGDGQVTTYDAHLLLSQSYTERFAVPAGSSVTVTVTAALTEAQKAALDADYENGAYIEGYTYIEPVATAEGELTDVTHSIPVLGFYGNWSDPSMFDKYTAADYIYGETEPLYCSGAVFSNNLVIRYKNDKSAYYLSGNPYLLEDALHTERYAIASETSLYYYFFTPIRNASVAFAQVTDQNGEVLYRSNLYEQLNSSYYNINDGAWKATVQGILLNKTPRNLGAEENDVLTVSLYAIPEYYEVDGALTNEQIDALLDSGALGEGVCLSTSMTVDYTAPVLLEAQKSLLSEELTVTVQDNNHVAYVAVMNEFGARVFTEAIPENHGRGQSTAYTFDLSGLPVGEYCTILVADYAGNESSYKLHYGGEGENYAGRMFGFTRGNTVLGTGDRWVEIKPDQLYYYYDRATATANHGGIENVAYTEAGNVVAAEYVDGYVFMACEASYYDSVSMSNRYTTTLWVSPQEDLTMITQLAAYEDLRIFGMAYNYADSSMYLLSNAGQADRTTTEAVNTIYTMDLNTGALTEDHTLTIHWPKESHTGGRGDTSYLYEMLRGLTIDDAGNFYSLNFGTNAAATGAYLYRWTRADAAEGSITELEPVNAEQITGFYSMYSSLAWDHDADVLYFASNASMQGYGNVNNLLVVIDPVTGVGSRATDYDGGYGAACASQMNLAINGLYIVPSFSSRMPNATEASDIELNAAAVTLLTGASYMLTADVHPWTLENRSVVWSSSDPSIATVDGEGEVLCLAPGEVTITAASVVSPEISASCTVTVTELPAYDLNALIYDAVGTPHWASLNTAAPEDWTALLEADRNYLAGAAHNDALIVHDGSNIYAVDAETFESKYICDIGTVAWSDAADCPAMGTDLLAPNGIVLLTNSGRMILAAILTEDNESNGFWIFDESAVLGMEALGAIAFAEQKTQSSGNGAWGSSTTTINYYYVLSEDGTLYQFTLFFSDGDNPHINLLELGELGLNLGNVSDARSDAFCSMEFDSETGYLLLSTHSQDEVNALYIIDPVTLSYAKAGELGEGIWPAVCLNLQEQKRTGRTVSVESSASVVTEGVYMSAETAVEGSLNNVHSTRETEHPETVPVVVDEESATVTVTFTQNAITNGL